jgi:hypothetical protein
MVWDCSSLFGDFEALPVGVLQFWVVLWAEMPERHSNSVVVLQNNKNQSKMLRVTVKWKSGLLESRWRATRDYVQGCHKAEGTAVTINGAFFHELGALILLQLALKTWIHHLQVQKPGLSRGGGGWVNQSIVQHGESYAWRWHLLNVLMVYFVLYPIAIQFRVLKAKP